MNETPTYFRATVLVLLAALIGIALLAQEFAPERLPDARNLAARLMAPLAAVEETAEIAEDVSDPSAETDVAAEPDRQPARIRAVPDAGRTATPAETAPAKPADGSGMTATPAVNSTEPEARVMPTPPEDVAEPPATEDAPVEITGDAEGQRVPVPDLSGLGERDRHAKAVADRLIAEGLATLVVDLAGSAQRMMTPGPGGSTSGARFQPWAPQATKHSRLHVALSATTHVLPVQALKLELRRAGILDPVTGFALVLTEETERTLFAAQKEILLAASYDPDALLAEDSSVVVHGCWQSEGDLVRLTAVTVDGSRWSRSGRPGC